MASPRHGGNLGLRDEPGDKLAEVAHAEAAEMVTTGDRQAIRARALVERRARHRVELARISDPDGDALAEPAVHLGLIQELKPHTVGERPRAFLAVVDDQRGCGSRVSESHGLRGEAVEVVCPGHALGRHGTHNQEGVPAADGYVFSDELLAFQVLGLHACP